MKERLIDIKQDGKVIHTFPVTIRDPLAKTNEEACKDKALEAAAHAKVVSNEDLEGLTAETHVSRSGPLQPYGDPLGVLAETKEGLDQFVRDRAYFLWEQAGRPDDKSEEFWHQAQHERWRERAHALWVREGCPVGKSDEHWHRMRGFEES